MLPPMFFYLTKNSRRNSEINAGEHKLTRLMAGEAAGLLQPMSYNVAKSNRIPDTSQTNARKMFEDVLPNIMESLATKSKFSEVPEVSDWVTKILNYNMAGGKKFRGITTVLAYEMSEKPENINEETMRLARVMGWCVEMLQAYLVMLDDVMDGATTRRGVVCWHRLPDVGLTAINDSIFVYSALFQTLKLNFSDRPHYNKILDIFNESLNYTAMGQHLDTSVMKRKDKNYDQFTIERYETIVKYKTSYYTFRLPISLGLLLANNADEATHQTVKDLSLKMGLMFQIQDDYIDCYGDRSVSGKDGTDIQEGKCSWLAVQALKRCTPKQRKVFEKCYSINQPACVERIQQLYNALNLPEVYSEFEKSYCEKLRKEYNSLPTTLPSALFTTLTDMIYKRVQ